MFLFCNSLRSIKGCFVLMMHAFKDYIYLSTYLYPNQTTDDYYTFCHAKSLLKYGFSWKCLCVTGPAKMDLQAYQAESTYKITKCCTYVYFDFCMEPAYIRSYVVSSYNNLFMNCHLRMCKLFLGQIDVDHLC